MDFTTLPRVPVRLENVTVPGWLLDRSDDLVRISISLDGDRIVAEGGTPVDMGGAMLLPTFTDMHTHLDKGHIWDRAPNPDGSFQGALETVGTDRAANWSADDIRTRMAFGLRCAFAYGTSGIRTHLDSIPPQDDISWPIFAELRTDWAGRIDLQAACLIGVDRMDLSGAFAHTADLVAEHKGTLGMVTYPIADLRDRLRGFFQLAADRGLSADFHADETMDPQAETLRAIAEVAIEERFDAPIVVGHCCSLSTQDEARAMDTLDLVAKAGLHIVSLPMCNLYLQDRQSGRTPRGRGITLVHEMKARGINVSFASDNTRDPFYAYGDLDMIEVMRQATRIGHLDHSDADWSRAFLSNPAAACGFAPPSLDPGAPADLVICKARSWTELFARPQSDRVVLRAGQQIDRSVPDYSELDHLMRTA
ncbi:cytosine deaminase [Aestuariivita sp.]|jgi:cytosine deaminase|uniref:cytosine deaminase n=1 Tax=Aestuariivita sp. TaxID=1872407 RepID=UPI0021725C4C|nr:cytosine deaminase [Aestuariivita sp.]MCE8008671.1 cytosine deaminase [Aestuariivita sp.]